jgi:hypothetical protein
MDFAEKLLESVCKPVIVYDIFLIALIIYNISHADLKSLFKNSLFLVFGTGLLWTLCYLGFSPVAWVLLSLPIFFVVSLLALLVLTQIIKTDVEYGEDCNKMLVGGRNWMNFFGYKDNDTIDRENGRIRNYSSDFSVDILNQQGGSSCKKNKPRPTPVIVHETATCDSCDENVYDE